MLIDLSPKPAPQPAHVPAALPGSAGHFAAFFDLIAGAEAPVPQAGAATDLPAPPEGMEATAPDLGDRRGDDEDVPVEESTPAPSENSAPSQVRSAPFPDLSAAREGAIFRLPGRIPEVHGEPARKAVIPVAQRPVAPAILTGSSAPAANPEAVRMPPVAGNATPDPALSGQPVDGAVVLPDTPPPERAETHGPFPAVAGASPPLSGGAVPQTGRLSPAPRIAGTGTELLASIRDTEPPKATQTVIPMAAESRASVGRDTPPGDTGTSSTPPAAAALLESPPVGGERAALVETTPEGPLHLAGAAGALSTVDTRATPPAFPVLQQVTQQAAQGMSAGTLAPGEGRIGVTLSPAELGRVELTLQEGDSRLVLVIQAERPETMDLMRRHIALLQEELARFGWSGLDLQLQNGTDRRGSDRPQHPGSASGPVQASHFAPPEATQPAVASDRLDLRL